MGSMGAAEAEVEGPAGARPDYAAMDRGDAPGGADDDCAPGGAAADDDCAPTAQAWRARAQRLTASAPRLHRGQRLLRLGLFIYISREHILVNVKF